MTQDERDAAQRLVALMDEMEAHTRALGLLRIEEALVRRQIREIAYQIQEAQARLCDVANRPAPFVSAQVH
jgi:hypothetical protein